MGGAPSPFPRTSYPTSHVLPSLGQNHLPLTTSVKSARTPVSVVLFHLSVFELRDAHGVGSGWRRAPWRGGGGTAPLGFQFHCPQPKAPATVQHRHSHYSVSWVCLPPVTSDVYMQGECREVQVSPDESWRLQNLGHTPKKSII